MEYVINCRLYKHNIYFTSNFYLKFNTFPFPFPISK